MLISRKGHNAKHLVFLVNNVNFSWEIPTYLFFFPTNKLALSRFLNGPLVEPRENY